MHIYSTPGWDSLICKNKKRRQIKQVTIKIWSCGMSTLAPPSPVLWLEAALWSQRKGSLSKLLKMLNWTSEARRLQCRACGCHGTCRSFFGTCQGCGGAAAFWGRKGIATSTLLPPLSSSNNISIIAKENGLNELIGATVSNSNVLHKKVRDHCLMYTPTKMHVAKHNRCNRR